MLVSKRFIQIIFLMCLPILVKANEVSNFWCSLGSHVNATCTVISQNDSEETKRNKFDAALGSSFDAIAAPLDIKIISVEPNQGKQGDTVIVIVTGENFQQDMKLKFREGIQILNHLPAATDVTKITAEIQIAEDAELGNSSVFVENHMSGNLDNAFEVLSSSSGENDDQKIRQPGKIQFAQAPHIVNETDGAYSLKVQRINGNDGLVMVKYGITPGTATAGEDFEAPITGRFTWLDGDSSDRTINFNLINDEKIEEPEKLTVTLTDIVGVSVLDVAIITINSEDKNEDQAEKNPGTIQFSASEYRVAENNVGDYSVNVKRVGGSYGRISVKYTMYDGTALAGQYFVATSGELIWEDGDDSSKTISVKLINDNEVEKDERFTISLANSESNESLGTTTVTINSEDKEKQEIPPGDEPEKNDGNPPSSTPTQGDTPPSSPNNGGNTQDGTKPIVIEVPSTPSTSAPTIVIPAPPKEPPPVEPISNPKPPRSEPDNLGENSGNNDIPIVPQECLIENNEIHGTCRFKEKQTLTNVTIGETGHVANAAFDGNIENHGWIYNSLFLFSAKLVGGILSGDIENEGILKDFIFVGWSLTGGTLGGRVINDSDVGGYFQDVHLDAGAHITGGILRGKIVGKAENRAYLEFVTIKSGSHLENVILENSVIGQDVQLGGNVELINVVFPKTLPSLESAIAVNPSGKLADSSTAFSGGISLNGSSYQSSAKPNLFVPIDILGHMTIDINDIDKVADILVVIHAVKQSQFYMLDTEKQMLEWDGEMSNLEAFEQGVTLKQFQEVEIPPPSLNIVGKLNIYFGYRLEDGVIVYNSEPINLFIDVQ